MTLAHGEPKSVNTCNAHGHSPFLVVLEPYREG